MDMDHMDILRLREDSVEEKEGETLQGQQGQGEGGGQEAGKKDQRQIYRLKTHMENKPVMMWSGCMWLCACGGWGK